jgi:hypothetical protein
MAKRLLELRSLLEKIWSNELNHNQANFFSTNDCGTAACVCGWDFALDRFNSVDDAKEMCESNEPFSNPWQYSREKYSLTIGESWLLFGPSSTEQLQKETLKMLEIGKCFKGYGFFQSSDYSSKDTINFTMDFEDDKKSITDFFDGSSLKFKVKNY